MSKTIQAPKVSVSISEELSVPQETHEETNVIAAGENELDQAGENTDVDEMENSDDDEIEDYDDEDEDDDYVMPLFSKAECNPSNWVITPQDNGELLFRNSLTGRTMEGSMKDFNEFMLLSVSVNE
jgi:hypothetical protein